MTLHGWTTPRQVMILGTPGHTSPLPWTHRINTFRDRVFKRQPSPRWRHLFTSYIIIIFTFQVIINPRLTFFRANGSDHLPWRRHYPSAINIWSYHIPRSRPCLWPTVYTTDVGIVPPCSAPETTKKPISHHSEHLDGLRNPKVQEKVNNTAQVSLFCTIDKLPDVFSESFRL